METIIQPQPDSAGPDRPNNNLPPGGKKVMLILIIVVVGLVLFTLGGYLLLKNFTKEPAHTEGIIL